MILVLFLVVILLYVFQQYNIENFYEFDTPEKITIHKLFLLSNDNMNRIFHQRIFTPQYRNRCK